MVRTKRDEKDKKIPTKTYNIRSRTPKPQPSTSTAHSDTETIEVPKKAKSGKKSRKRSKRVEKPQPEGENVQSTSAITNETVERLEKERGDSACYKAKIVELEKLHADFEHKMKLTRDKSSTVSTPKSERVLECKHLTQGELREYFNRNIDYCRNIYKNVHDNERHRLFMLDESDTSVLKNRHIVSGPYNSAQILYLMDLATNAFEDIGEYHFRIRYVARVLITEILLKIFMDVYNMDKDTAFDYLSDLADQKDVF